MVKLRKSAFLCLGIRYKTFYEHLVKTACSPIYLISLIQCNTYSEVLQVIKFVK